MNIEKKFILSNYPDDLETQQKITLPVGDPVQQITLYPDLVVEEQGIDGQLYIVFNENTKTSETFSRCL